MSQQIFFLWRPKKGKKIFVLSFSLFVFFSVIHSSQKKNKDLRITFKHWALFSTGRNTNDLIHGADAETLHLNPRVTAAEETRPIFPPIDFPPLPLACSKTRRSERCPSLPAPTDFQMRVRVNLSTPSEESQAGDGDVRQSNLCSLTLLVTRQRVCVQSQPHLHFLHGESRCSHAKYAMFIHIYSRGSLQLLL